MDALAAAMYDAQEGGPPVLKPMYQLAKKKGKQNKKNKNKQQPKKKKRKTEKDKRTNTQ